MAGSTSDSDAERAPLLEPPAEAEEQIEALNEKTSDRFIVILAFLGVFIASADESLVISTYSSIASQFHQLAEGSWLLLAYNFGYCISLPVYGALGEVYGRKNVLVVSYLLFTFSCLACGASTSLVQLVLSRVLTGATSAGSVVMVSVILTDLLPKNDIALYRGYQNVVNVTGRSVGAPIGGFLADTIGWRWSFYGQVPIVLLCTLLTFYRLPSSINKSKAREDDQDPETSRHSVLWDLDYAGIITFSGTILIMLFLIRALGAPTEDTDYEILILAFAFVAGCLLFVVIELFWARKPLIPVRMVSQSIGAYWVLQVLLLSSRFALVSNIVPYLIRAENTSDFMASIWLVVTSVGVSMGGVFSGLVIKRTNRFKKMCLTASFFTLLFYTLILIQYPHGFHPWQGIYLLLVGFAPGILFPALFVGMSASAPEGTLSVCISTYYLSQQLGLVIGPAVGAALTQRLFLGGLQGALQGVEDKRELIDRVLNEVRYANGLPEKLREIVRACYLSSFRALPVFSIVATMIMVPILALLKEPSLA
ncbi:major facilitator superfamily domain-containing protein [Aspergillus crustosus]